MSKKAIKDAFKGATVTALALAAIIMTVSIDADSELQVLLTVLLFAADYLLARKWYLDEEQEQIRQAFDDEDTPKA